MNQQREFVILIMDPEPSSRHDLQQVIQQTFQDSISLIGCHSGDQAISELQAAIGRSAHIPLIISTLDDESKLIQNIRDQLPYLNSYTLILASPKQRQLAEQLVSDYQVNELAFKPWQRAVMAKTLKDLLSRYILRYANDQLPYYENVVSHHHYRKALEESERHRIALHQQLGQFAQSLLDVQTVSDHELLGSLATELARFVKDPERVFRQYSSGDWILQQASTNNQLQIILEGTVLHLAMDDNRSQREIFMEGEGAIIGSLSFFSSKPALTSVKAISPVRTMSFDQSILDQALSEHVGFLMNFTNLLLRQVLSRVRKNLDINIRLQQTLSELKQAQLRLIESEKLATLGQLVAGVAHELNNPAAALVRSADHLGQLLQGKFEGVWQVQPKLQGIASQVFQRGYELSPISTRELRSRSVQLEPALKSSALARQAVEIGFATREDLERLEKTCNTPVLELIPVLGRYFQIGRFLRNIASSGGRIDALVKSLKNYARQESNEFELLDLHEGLEESLLILQHRLKHFEVIKDYGELPKIYGLPSSLNQVWTNLISNALDAMGENGRLAIKTSIDQSEQAVLVSIKDNGPGIQAELLDQIFAINYTTKRGTGFGLGLGLAICKSIVEKHDGEIVVRSEPGTYAEFTVKLPIHQQS